MNFARANLLKIVGIPLFFFGWCLAKVVPRNAQYWAFGSGSGIGEGSLAVALEIQRLYPEHRIYWIAQSDRQKRQAQSLGFRSVTKSSAQAFWHTLRAGHIVVTHGLGDVNRYGVFCAEITHLVHGAPLKKLHLDSQVTTAVSGPRVLQMILKKMYRFGGSRFTMIVAGSETAARRLRSAYQILPGKVAILGDARDDVVFQQWGDADVERLARLTVCQSLGIQVADLKNRETPSISATQRNFLYAPTWRDGAPDPEAPTAAETLALHQLLERLDANLMIRSHPLGAGQYAHLVNERVHLWGNDAVQNINEVLSAFDVLITDYSSIAVDYSILERPIIWFAPDADEYAESRGLYERYSTTTHDQSVSTWAATIDRLSKIADHDSPDYLHAVSDSRALKHRFHAFQDGYAAQRVAHAIINLSLPDSQRVPNSAVFFESFYGSRITCNPAAIDKEIARSYPDVPRYWSVNSESVIPPLGAIPVLVGSPDWRAARSQAHLLIVNDWLRFGFRRGKHQTVLQTWHGTMLKHLALTRPNVSLRTRIAILRESRRWSYLLSQNPHSTENFRASYDFRGEIFELGYPRDDVLANSLSENTRSEHTIARAKQKLGIAPHKRVLLYAPTWRDHSEAIVNQIDVVQLARELGNSWVIVTRAHSRARALHDTSSTYESILDASEHPEINDLILAADLLVTDYSSVMFDAAIARVPIAFFVPDLAHYREIERGFTFDFVAVAPGPLCETRSSILERAQALESQHGTEQWRSEFATRYENFIAMFAPHDDGAAAKRVVRQLRDRGSLSVTGTGSVQHPIRPK